MAAQAALSDGGIWGVFLALDGFFLKEDIQEKKRIHRFDDGASYKADLLWQANKRIFTSSAAFVSTGAMATAWLAEMGCIPIGGCLPIVASIGYGGRVLSSSLRLYECAYELGASVLATLKSEGILSLYKHTGKMLAVALYVTVIAWGALGVVASLLPTAKLFSIVDHLFYLSGILVCGNILALFASSKEEEVLTLETPPKEERVVGSPSLSSAY